MFSFGCNTSIIAGLNDMATNRSRLVNFIGEQEKTRANMPCDSVSLGRVYISLTCNACFFSHTGLDTFALLNFQELAPNSFIV